MGAQRGGQSERDVCRREKNSGLPVSVPVPKQGLRLCSGVADRHGAGPAPMYVLKHAAMARVLSALTGPVAGAIKAASTAASSRS